MPKQILLVEDSVTMQKVVQITFAREDFQIVTATTADEALARCKESRPDVVLADAGLSGKSGYDLAAALKADAGLTAPVILLTGNFNPYDEARGQRSGIDGHIVKPFDTQSMIDKVKAVLGAGPAVAAAPKAVTPVAVAPAPAAAKPVSAPAPAVAAAAPRQTPAPVATPPAASAAAAAAAAASEAARSTMMGMPSMSPPVGSPSIRPPAAQPVAAPRPTPTATAPATGTF